MIGQILLAVTLTSVCDGANILGIFLYPSESHHLLGSILLGNLAKRGHNVTYISPFRTKASYPNFTHLVIDDILKYRDENLQKNAQKETSYFENVDRLNAVNGFQDIFFKNPKIKWFLKSDSQYDLMIHFVGMDPSVALAHHFDIPVIVFSPFGGLSWVDVYFGNPMPIAYLPVSLGGAFSDAMTFSQRLVNVFVDFLLTSIRPKVISRSNRAIAQYLPGTPTLEEIHQDRIAMAFINSHVSTETPRPYLPAMVQIGGYNLQEPERISSELKKSLDNAKNGVIYFSFGTNIKLTDISKEKLGIILKSLGEVPLKVLMKFDSNTLDNKPDNVEVRSWYPQRAVLSHPNVKLFIGHGGYGGCTESLYYGVPMICIPFFLDQPKNCADVERHGYGIHLPLNRLTTEAFRKALEKTLNDKSFIAKAKLKSDLYRDQEMNPMDRAEYWVNHVIKHKGAKHLRAKALDLYWYQYYLLDVVAFIVAVLLVLGIICYYVLNYYINTFGARFRKLKTN